MATNIESLELEIRSNSSQAVTGINALSSSLSKLKNAVKGGIGLSAVSNQITNLDAAVRSVDAASADKITNLANSLARLRSVSSIKIPASIGNQIRNIASASSFLKTENNTAIEGLANSVKSLNGISKSTGLQSLITQLQKLPQVAKALKDTDIDTFCSSIDKLSRSLGSLATNTSSATSSIGKLPRTINKASVSANRAAASNVILSHSYVNLWAKARIVYNTFRVGIGLVSSWINSSNEYIEDVNLFTVSLGEYASEARDYAETVSAVMGIDPGQFMRYEGIFNTIITGFGVANDKAYLMSKNLTQLGYDISSLYYIPFEDSMTKLQSGIAGELEPLRRLGYDLSVARLQQEAYNLGITKSVSEMTQAEKSQLRYHAILTQVTVAQGDMARTLEAPANQLRILQTQATMTARALGNIFIPALNAVLPYAIAFVKIIREVANAIADFFGFEMPEFEYSGLQKTSAAVSDIADGTDDIASGLSGARKQAEKLQRTIMSFDELHVLNSPNDNTSSGGGSAGADDVTGGGFDIDLPEYDFLKDAVETRVDRIFSKMKDTLKEAVPYATAIAAAFGAMALSDKLLPNLKKLSDYLKTIKDSFNIVGAVAFFADMAEFSRYMDDLIENGPSLLNVGGMLTEFAGLVSDAFLVLGNIKISGVLKVVQGISEIVLACKDIDENGVNWSNVMTAIRGIGTVIIGIGILQKDYKIAGIGLSFQGLTTIIRELAENWEAIKEGDFSGVDKVTLVIAAIETFSGIAMALGKFSGAVKDLKLGDTKQKIEDITSTTDTLKTSSSHFTPDLSSAVKNIGYGVLIIGEIAGAAILLVGAIAVLGWELGKVADAWQPVIDNGETVLTAMGIGTGMLVGIGVAAYGLGTLGAPVAINIGIGTGVLAEVSLAAILFVGAIAEIGDQLVDVIDAWSPINGRGGEVAKDIALGTAMLVGIGVVAFALGTATVASAGTIPIAIGIGTGMLLLLSGAFILFTNALVDVADTITKKLSPAFRNLDSKLPNLNHDMSDFKDFMHDFAMMSLDYAGDTAIAGLSGTISTIISFFTGNPFKKLYDEIDPTKDELIDLNDTLDLINPELKEVNSSLDDYKSLMKEFAEKSGEDNITAVGDGLNVNMQNIGKNLVTGFAQGITSSIGQLSEALAAFGANVDSGLKSGGISREHFAELAKDAMAGFDDVFKKSGNKSTIKVKVELVKKGWSTVAKWIGKIPTIDQPIALKKSGWSTVANWVGRIVTLYQNIGLKKYGWRTVASWIGTLPVIYQRISLKKSGWASVKSWVGNIPTIYQLVGLKKSGWASVKAWVAAASGGTVIKAVGLSRSGWSTVASWVNSQIGGSVTVTVYLRKGWSGSFKNWLGLAGGGIITDNGKVRFLANGGIFNGATWSALPKYASGTRNAHGSLFVAGENGPEIIGHANGRTEILNLSQIAQVMKSSMLSAMIYMLPSVQSINASIRDMTQIVGDKVDRAAAVANAIPTNPEADYSAIIDTAVAKSNSTNTVDTSSMLSAEINEGINASNAEQNELLREQNELLRELLEKNTTVEIPITSITRAMNDMNRRYGKTVVGVEG